MSMRILWITGRRLDSDLAASTEAGLSRALTRIGLEISMISPSNSGFEGIKGHSFVDQSRILGLQTISTGRNCAKLIKRDSDLLREVDLVLVDWRLVGSIWKTLRKSTIPWAIIDRGPPAKKGILAEIQNIQWKRSWKIASRNSIGGFVVSLEHKKLVRRFVSRGMEIFPVPAGTNIGDFNFLPKYPKDVVKFVYSGVLDENRGMRRMLGLLDSMDRLPIKANLVIAGSGDWEKEIQSIASKDERLHFLGEIGFDEVCKMLEEAHVGIMPMPETTIWRTSSPLKLAEYLASGLITIGPKHQGNSLLGENSWELLSESENWNEECMSLISDLIESNSWREVSEQSRRDSSVLDWGNIANGFIDNLEAMMGQSL